MGIMKTIGEILSPNDPELVEKTLRRLEQQDIWNDAFSTALLEILDTKDSLKGEIRKELRDVQKRLSQAEAVIQAESVLKDKAGAFKVGLENLEAALAAEERATLRANNAGTQLETATIHAREARAKAESAERHAEEARKNLVESKTAAEDAKGLLRSATIQAEHTQGLADQANAQFKVCRELATRAQRFFRRGAIAAVVAVGLCFLAVTWMGYSLLRTTLALTAATTVSALIVIVASLIFARVLREA